MPAGQRAPRRPPPGPIIANPKFHQNKHADCCSAYPKLEHPARKNVVCAPLSETPGDTYEGTLATA